VTNLFAGSTGQVSLHGSLPLAHRVQTLGSQFSFSTLLEMSIGANDARCKFSYICANNANEETKLQSLATETGGAIKTARDHELVTAIGHLLPPPLNGYVVMDMHLVEFLVMTYLIFDHDLDTRAPRWNIKLAWLSALWAELLNAGMATGRAETIESLRERVQGTMAALPDASRILRGADVIFNPTATETWWDHISPRRLRAGDMFNTVLAQLRAMVTGHWGQESHKDYPFQSALELLVPVLFESRSAAAQAAGVVALLRRTAVRAELDTFVSPECGNDEVGRRLQDTAEAAFIPLFERSWKTAFPELVTMLPACSDPHEVILIVKGLLPRVNLPNDFTDANVVAFCKNIKQHLSNIASAPSTREGQDARVEQLMASVRTETSQGALGSRKETESEQVMALYQRQDFQDLNTVLEGMQTLPLNGKAVVSEMLTAQSAAGWLQLAGRSVPQKAFRTMRGLSADKGINTIHEYINSALATNLDGTTIDGAGTLISEKVARNTISGGIANGSGKDQLDYWNDIALPVVIKRDGRDAVATLAPLANAADFFVDPPRMELALDVLTTWFAAFGYDGRGTGSLNATLRNIMKAAKTLLRMRNTEPRKAGLIVMFRDAANSIFAEFATTIRAMLAGPIGSAMRPQAVMLPNTTAAASWTAAVAALAAVVDEHKKYDVGLGRPDGAHLLALSSPPASTATLSTISAHSSGQFGAQPSVLPDDSASQYGGNASGVGFGWGHLAQRHGVYEAGASIAFGANVCTYISQMSLPDAPFCWAPYAPDKTNERRSSWCTQPNICKTHADHDRPAGLTQDMISSAYTTDGKIDSTWKPLYKATKKRAASDAGGKGKGKGKSKNAKGRGGRGRGRGFGRQQ
jgi:hypothetical protein